MKNKLVSIVMLVLLLCTCASAATYYVKTGGDDNDTGLSDANAWATINKVNGSVFSAGDNIYFNRGDTWAEQLTVPSSGSEGSPITFGAYGSGNLPIITGCREVPGWTVAGDWTDEGGNVYSFGRLFDRHRLWLDGTEYVHAIDAADVDVNKRWSWENDKLYVYSPTGKPPTDYSSMIETNSAAAAAYIINKDYITLEYLDLRGGNTTVYLDTGCSNFIIDNCAVGLDGWYGFFIRGSITGEIKNCTIESGWNFPTYTSNELYQLASTWDGIYIVASTANSGSFLIHDNTFKDWGHNGICLNAPTAPYTLSGCEIYDNEICGENSIVMRAYTTETDDADLCINNKFYRNNCHDTTKSSHINGNGNEVYYNIFRDITNIVTGAVVASGIDLQGYVGGDCKDNKIYNNIFVNTEEPGIDVSGDGAGDKEGNEITNNIFYNTGYNSAQAHDSALWIDDHATINGNTFKNNLFYTSGMTDVVYYRGVARTIAEFNAENGSNSDVISGNISSDPLFVDANNNDFNLADGSPCIGVGVDVGLSVDYDGKVVSDPPEIGAFADDEIAPRVANCSPAADSIQVLLNNLISLNITDAGTGVDADSVTIQVNNNIVYTGDTNHYTSIDGHCYRTGTKADYTFIYQSDEMFDYDQTVTITVNATDLAGNVMNEYSYSFATEMPSFGQNKQVNSGLDNNDRPVTVCDSSGNIWAAWHAGSAGNRDIYISKLAAGADNFGSTVQLTSNATDQFNPAVALDSNDKLYVVWQDNREGDWDIYVSTSVDGISWSTGTRVNDPNNGNQVNPAIVIDGQNYAHVVWQDDRAGNQDICIATSSDGFATKTISQITTDTFDQVEPAIAADSANTIYVVWTDGRNGSNDIYGAASNNPWTNVAIVSNTNNQSSPAIAAESTGSILHLLWVDDTSGDNDIYYASSDGLPGSPLTGSSIIDDSSGAYQLDPTIAVTGSTNNNLKVFACWQDWRNTDTDLYFAELSAGSGTNVFVGDDGSSAYQGEPAIGIDEYGYPYLIWADNRSTTTDIYYAGSTFIEPVALASELVTASASSSTTVGTDPQAITTLDDVSIVVPAGACSYDVTITVTKIANLPAFAAPCLGGYDFGPSGIQFSQPVTITIPYVFFGSDGSATPYWFNLLTGALSQQGITDIQDIPISSSLHALSFKTTHFTAFFLFAGGGAAAIVSSGGGGGGCSVSASGEGNIVEYILPYIGLAVVMAILKMRDVRDRKACNTTAGKC